MRYLQFLTLFIFFTSSIHAQTNYNELPLEIKIRIKEGNSEYFLGKLNSNNFGASILSSPEQDCNSAIPVCQNVYNTAVSYSGEGNSQEIPGNSCLGSNEKNSVWYTFSTSSSGNLAFNITPNNLSDDYDFALYDITGSNCSGISSGAITPIRCNFAATSGVTGLSSSGTNASEPASGSNQSTVLATTPGKTYVLVISNYSSSQSGYTLDFTPGTASIFDNIPPTPQSVTAPCGSSNIVFNASEQIKCNTIAANGSDFTVTGTGGPYVVTAASGQNCGINTAQINLTISPALSGAGPWTIGIVSGSDGNTLIDACGNAMTPQTLTFTTVPPTVTISGPSEVCKGVVFALTASSASSYTWSGASVPAGQQNQQSISVTANSPGTLNFTVTVTNGTCGNSSANTAVTVKAGPTAHFALASQTICAGQTASLTNQSIIPNTCNGLGITPCTASCGFLQPCQATPLTNFNVINTWSFGDPASGGNNFATSVDATHTYNTPGTYYINLNTNFLIGGGCNTSETQTIVVLPAAANLTVSPTQTICAGQTATISASGGTSYTWSPSSSVGSPNSGTTTVTPSVTTIFTVSSPGCSGTQTATVQVSINNIPPSIGVISGTNSVCANQTNVSYSVANVAGTNYTWTVPAGASITTTPTNTNNILVNFGNNAGTIQVVATSSCGTASSSLAINLNPALTVSVTPTNSSICAGSSVTLTASGATNYTWSPSLSLNTTSGNEVVASPTTNTTYTVVGANGTCTGSNTAIVTIASSLTINATSNTPTVCLGNSALLSATGATSYTWSNASTLSSANGSGVTATPLTNTTYTVIGASGTCTGVATVSVGIGNTGCISSACDLNLIRTTMTNAGNIELLGLNNPCSLYFLNPQPMTGSQAQTFAESLGANLVSVQSATENAAIVTALSNQGYAGQLIWIGFSDEVTEGNFTWYDGSPIVYTNWAPGEPNNAGDEDCVQIYADGGWNDLSCFSGNSMSIIEVNICPQVTVTPVPNHCPNSVVTVTASTLFGAPNYTYTWFQSGTETFTTSSVSGTNDVISITSIGANTFTVFSVDRYSCPQFTSFTSSVLPSPTITVNSASICLGQQIATLTANGATNYTWSPSSDLSSATGSIVTGTPSSSQTYSIIGTDDNGCKNTATATITVNNLPVISISPNVTICPSESATLTTSGASSYTWSPGNSINSANATTVIASPTIATTYTISGSDNGCIGTNTVNVYVSGNGYLPNVYIIQKNTQCDTSILNWLNITSVSPNLAQGNLPSGLTVNATHSGGGMSTTPSMFNGAIFPATYSVPVNATTIRNDLGGTFNFCFNQPVINPQIAFASIGQAGLPITINTSSPYQVLWTGTNMTYSNPYSLIGEEGFTIIRFPGIHTCITLDYVGNETYCNLAFGVMDTDCQDQPVCPGQPVELLANGATSYTWNTGATSSSIAPTPSINTTYTLIGSNSDGCINTATTTIQILPSPTITVNSSSICIGQQTATLTANGATNYTWSPSSDLSSSSGSVVVGNPSSTKNYTVNGTDINGCHDTAYTTITVLPLPSITVNSSTICVGQQTATLTANGAVTYSWIPGTDLSSTTGSIVTGNPTSSQTYTVGGIDSNGCINGTITSIFVNTLPTVTVNSSTICIGQQTATLNANGALTYTWFPSTDLSSNTGSVVTGTPTVTQSYTLIGTDANGCYNDTVTTIFVNQLPTVTVNSETICLGQQTATLTANGASTYSWSPGNNLSSTSGSVVTSNAISTQNYTVTGTDNNSCYNSSISTISVNALPVLITSSNFTVCPLETTSLSVSGATNYTWSPSTFLNNTNSPTVVSIPSTSITYTVIGESNSCTSDTIISVTVSNTVVVIANATTPTICPAGTTTLTASGATNYTWSPSSSLNSSNLSTVTANPASNETYTVIGATGTCTNSAEVIVTVTVNPIISVVNSPTICSGSGANLSASGANSYTWAPDNTLNSTSGANVSASPLSTNIYSVTGSSILGCKSSATVEVTVIPTPTISVTSNTLTICDGNSASLIASGSLTNSYTWTPSSSLDNSQTPSVIASPNTTTTYSVTGTNGTVPNLCTSSNTIQITVLPKTTVNIPTVSPICYGGYNTIYATGGNIFSWAPSNSLSAPNKSITIASPSVTTIYTLTTSNNSVCPNTATVELVVNPLPIVNAGNDTTVNIDELVQLNGTGNVEVGFYPTNGEALNCNFCPTIYVQPLETTCYILKGTNAYGCVNTDTVCVYITKDWNVYVPNAFSPNGDGINDVFSPYGYALKEIKMRIFNRWGQEIFVSNDSQLGWDGKYKGEVCETGVYVYLIEVTSMGGEVLNKTGHVTLLYNQPVKN